MVPLAKELAAALEGELIALFQQPEAKAVSVLIAVEENGGGLLVVDVPEGTTSLDDVPDTAEHYSSGLALAQEMEKVSFSTEEGRDAIMSALTGFDRKRSFQIATGWMQLAIARKAARDAKP